MRRLSGACSTALDHDDFGLIQSKVSVIYFQKAVSGMLAENRFPLFLIPLCAAHCIFFLK